MFICELFVFLETPFYSIVEMCGFQMRKEIVRALRVSSSTGEIDITWMLF